MASVKLRFGDVKTEVEESNDVLKTPLNYLVQQGFLKF